MTYEKPMDPAEAPAPGPAPDAPTDPHSQNDAAIPPESNGMPRALTLSIMLHLAILGLGFFSAWRTQAEHPAGVYTVFLTEMAGAGAGPGGGKAGTEEKGDARPFAPRPEKQTSPASLPGAEKHQKNTPVLKKVLIPPSEPQHISPAGDLPSTVVEKSESEKVSDTDMPPSGNPGEPNSGTASDGSGQDGGVQGSGSGHGATDGGGLSGSGGGGSAGEGPIDAAFGTKDGPRFIGGISPEYPRRARDAGQEGTVVLLLTIDAQGTLIDVEVLASAGATFDASAMQAVKIARFNPAQKNGKAILCRARLPIRFKLDRN